MYGDSIGWFKTSSSQTLQQQHQQNPPVLEILDRGLSINNSQFIFYENTIILPSNTMCLKRNITAIVLTRYKGGWALTQTWTIFSQRSLDTNHIPLWELIDRWKFYENKQNSLNEAEIKCFIIWSSILTRSAMDHENVETVNWTTN